MVGRCHHNIGFGVALGNFVTGIGNAGSRVAGNGFAQHLIVGQARDLLLAEVFVFIACDNVNIFGWANPLETVGGLLKQGAARTQNIMKLFGVVGAAKRPEPCSNPARHDNDVCMVHK